MYVHIVISNAFNLNKHFFFFLFLLPHLRSGKRRAHTSFEELAGVELLPHFPWRQNLDCVQILLINSGSCNSSPLCLCLWFSSSSSSSSSSNRTDRWVHFQQNAGL